MAGTGLPIPKDRPVQPQPGNVVGVGAYSTAQSWLQVADAARQAAAAAGTTAGALGDEINASARQIAAADRMGEVGAALSAKGSELARLEQRQAEIAQIADF